jgi:hypothetical protein
LQALQRTVKPPPTSIAWQKANARSAISADWQDCRPPSFPVARDSTSAVSPSACGIAWISGPLLADIGSRQRTAVGLRAVRAKSQLCPPYIVRHRYVPRQSARGVTYPIKRRDHGDSKEEDGSGPEWALACVGPTRAQPSAVTDVQYIHPSPYTPQTRTRHADHGVLFTGTG